MGARIKPCIVDHQIKFARGRHCPITGVLPHLDEVSAACAYRLFRDANLPVAYARVAGTDNLDLVFIIQGKVQLTAVQMRIQQDGITVPRYQIYRIPGRSPRILYTDYLVQRRNWKRICLIHRTGNVSA